MGDQAEPWNLPPYQLTLGGQYSLREKLIVKLDAVLMGKRKAFSPVWSSVQDPSPDRTEVVELNGFVDLHLGAEYRYTKRLSVFLQASNLSASRYERWYRYPVQRTLLIGGAGDAFLPLGPVERTGPARGGVRFLGWAGLLDQHPSAAQGLALAEHLQHVKAGRKVLAGQHCGRPIVQGWF